MAYKTDHTSKIPAYALDSRGAVLAKHALRLGFEVAKIALATGATRQSVYNWFKGKQIAPYYATHVETLTEILKNADTAENAWRKVCLKFDLKT